MSGRAQSSGVEGAFGCSRTAPKAKKAVVDRDAGADRRLEMFDQVLEAPGGRVEHEPEVGRGGGDANHGDAPIFSGWPMSSPVRRN